MIALLLDIYILFVWLVFIKFKLLKFDLKAKIAVGVVGVIFIFGILIGVNFLHPQTMDARVYQHVIQVAAKTSQPGRVLEVPVSPNVPVKQGDVLFQLDPKPFQLEVDRLQASLQQAEQSVPQLQAALLGAQANTKKATTQRDLAQGTLDRNLKAGIGVSAQDLDESRRNFDVATNSAQGAKAAEEQARLAIDIGGQKVAETKAQLAKAQLDLDETTVQAPADGFVTNLQLQPGFVVAPGTPVLTFVVNPEGVVVATFPQEYLESIEPGNDVEVALDLYPGRMLHGKVESIIWASGQGQLTPSGTLPTAVQTEPAARFAVKVRIGDEDRAKYRLPAGASGAAAVYTNHVKSLRIVRKVVVRWYTWLNYVKLAMQQREEDQRAGRFTARRGGSTTARRTCARRAG